MKNTGIKNKKRLGYTVVELVVVIAILSILILIAVPSLGHFIEDSKRDKADTLAVLLNSNIQREFVDLNGLVLDLDKLNDPNSAIMQDIKSNENLNSDAIVKFYSAGYENTTAIESLLSSEISPSLTTDYVGIVLPDNDPTAQFSKTPVLNLNKPIKIIIKFSDNEETYIYENGVNVTSEYISG